MADPVHSSASSAPERSPGVPGYPGPYAVGRVAGRLRDRLRELPPVCVIGEVTGARVSGGPNVYFELRDSDGALPCAMWREDFERTGLSGDVLRDGAEVVAAGGFDYYPGSATSSPRISFRVKELRPAGEGDLLAQLARLRRQLASEGLFEPQKLLPRAALPRRLGVVTAAGSAASRDFLAGLERRGWRGTIVWGHAPVQDRRAAPAIGAAIRELAAVGAVEAIVVTRGGGSIADLWAFCDETLCRTVALTPVPVISAVGHDVDRTLIDDVAAVCCSTPTHAAEAAVRIDCGAARTQLARASLRVDGAGRAAVVEPRLRVTRAAVRVQRAGRAALLERARALVAQSRAPRDHLDRHRVRLHQLTREMRAAAGRGRRLRIDFQRRIAVAVIGRRREAALLALVGERGAARKRVRSIERAGDQVEERAARLSASAASLERARRALEQRSAEALAARAAALRAHDPERTLERGYAVLLDERGEPLAGVSALRGAGRFQARLADGTVGAQVLEIGETEEVDER
jgi:exodeoxyribonuclease VII large subunit